MEQMALTRLVITQILAASDKEQQRERLANLPLKHTLAVAAEHLTTKVLAEQAEEAPAEQAAEGLLLLAAMELITREAAEAVGMAQVQERHPVLAVPALS